MCPPASAIHSQTNGPRAPERPGTDLRCVPNGRTAGKWCFSALLERRHGQARVAQLVPVVLGELLMAGPHDRQAGAVDAVGDLVAAIDGHAGDEARQGVGDAVEGVVIVVADDHPPGAAQGAVGAFGAGKLDGLAHVSAAVSRFFHSRASPPYRVSGGIALR